MRKLLVPVLLACLILFALFGVLRGVRGQVPVDPGQADVLQREAQGENVREILAPVGSAQQSPLPEGQAPADVSPNEPQISFIDSPTAACTQPDPAKDDCFLNWYYLSVNADPNYMITMTLTLNDIGPVARYHGFFQTSMYAPHTMNPRGYKVACGAPGAGGDPDWGRAYAYTIRARDSAGLKSGNFGTVYCPPYTPDPAPAAP
jgi:hypothetical protein